MLDPNESAMARALGGSLRDYREPEGADLLRRVEGFFEWQDLRRQHRLWPYSKSTSTAPKTSCIAQNDAGEEIAGINFASQDYLSLSSHPRVVAAAKAAIEQYGVHSAGSSALLGNSHLSLQLERAISEFLGGRQTVVYPAGWSAGFGAVQGLVRANDHVVMDVLSHSCLQEGARAATQNIHLYGHLNAQSARRKLQKIRAADAKNGILVVTESLFSMHSDTPDLAALKAACEEFNATLLVDTAHDLGCIGEDGLGHIGLQCMLDRVDVIVGSFSKTFASNGGFVAARSRAVKEYLKYYSATQTFSNALSPVQAAAVLAAFEIVRSPEGNMLRRELMDNVLYLRSELKRARLEVLANPSPIVPVQVGAEGHARMAAQRLAELGVIANLVEYPAVPKGGARFRLQVMAKHRREDIDLFVRRLRSAVDETEGAFRQFQDTHRSMRLVSAAAE